MPIPADLFGQDLRDPWQFTIYDLLLTIALRPRCPLWKNKRRRIKEIYLEFSGRFG